MAHIKLTYTLSNKQIKELQRGTRLFIALPQEPFAKPSRISMNDARKIVTDFIASRLKLPEGVRVIGWEVSHVNVSPDRNPQNVGLSALLGDIMHEIGPDTIAYSVSCLVVTIGTERHNGTTHPPKWPGGETIREVVG